jgi:hypothetical protein
LGSPSGIYVAKTPNEAALIQLVRSEGGHLSGRFEGIRLEPDGSIKDLGGEVSGVIDGQNILINVDPTGLSLGKVTLSGSLQMGHLHLTGHNPGGPLNIDMDRSDQRTFDDRAVSLRAQGNEIVAARAKQAAALALSNTAAEKYQMVQRAVATVEAFNARAERALPKIGAFNDRFRFITERMKSDLAREQSIHGAGQASVARGQLSGAIDQTGGAGIQLHMGEEDSRRDLVNDATAVEDSKTVADGACVAARAGRLGPVSVDAWNTVCGNLANVGQTLSSELDRLRAGFAELDATWADESAKQDQIEKAGDRAVN